MKHTIYSRSLMIAGVMAGCAVWTGDVEARNYPQLVREDPMEVYQRRQAEKSGDETHYSPYSAAYEEARQEVLGGGGHDDDEYQHEDTFDFNETMAQAQAGDPEAIGLIATAYANGIGVERNESAAAQWYERAIEYGATQYYSHLGDLYRDYDEGQFSARRVLSGDGGRGSIRKDNQVAKAFYTQGIYKDDARSYMQLSLMYRDGHGGLERSPTQAKYYRDKAAEIRQRQNKAAERERVNVAYHGKLREQGLQLPDEQSPTVPQTSVATEAGTAAVTITVGGRACQVVGEQQTPNYSSSLLVQLSCRDIQGQPVAFEGQTTANYRGGRCNVVPVASSSVPTLQRNYTHQLECQLSSANADTNVLRVDGHSCSVQYSADLSGLGGVPSYRLNCEENAHLTSTSAVYQGNDCVISPENATTAERNYILRCRGAVAPQQ